MIPLECHLLYSLINSFLETTTNGLEVLLAKSLKYCTENFNHAN